MIRRLTTLLIVLAVAAIAAITLRDLARRHPERLPWTPLSLARPIGPFTGMKLARLTQDAPRCRTLLADAGIDFTPLAVIGTAECGYADGVRVTPSPTVPAVWRPTAPALACPVAAALYLWERDIVAPAARRHFGKRVTGIDHLGSYNCRRIAGNDAWSEHATANAIDIAGLRLKGGERIRILPDWNGPPEKAAFLREIRDGACTLFATTLSPDYNPAHADHFHLDQARRGMAGGSVCR